MGGFAWVTLATNDSYSLGALVLAHSLRKSNTAHKLVVLITPAVSQPMREQLQTVFDLVKLVEVLDSKDEAHLALLKRPELGITFTKIHCWRLTEFDKCVFLDADTLVVRNCDELFERDELSAAPDFSWPDCFNSGVFVFKPSVETFNKIIQFAVEKGSFDGGDQGLLNQFFSGWATEDIKKHLPFVYNLSSLAAYSYIPAFKQYGSETRIVHFIGTGKPWLQKLDPATRTITPTSGAEHLTPLLQQWWDIFCEKVHPNLDKNLSGIAGAIAQLSLESSEPSATASSALQEYVRRQNWETGNMDYMGRDSFDNIWAKICQTLEGKELEELIRSPTAAQNIVFHENENQQLQEQQQQLKLIMDGVVQPTESKPKEDNLSSTLNPECIETLPSEPPIRSTEEDDIIFSTPNQQQSLLTNVAEGKVTAGSPTTASFLPAEVKTPDVKQISIPSVPTEVKDLSKESNTAADAPLPSVIVAKDKDGVLSDTSVPSENVTKCIPSSDITTPTSVVEVKKEATTTPSLMEITEKGSCGPPIALPMAMPGEEKISKPSVVDPQVNIPGFIVESSDKAIIPSAPAPLPSGASEMPPSSTVTTDVMVIPQKEKIAVTPPTSLAIVSKTDPVKTPPAPLQSGAIEMPTSSTITKDVMVIPQKEEIAITPPTSSAILSKTDPVKTPPAPLPSGAIEMPPSSTVITDAKVIPQKEEIAVTPPTSLAIVSKIDPVKTPPIPLGDSTEKSGTLKLSDILQPANDKNLGEISDSEKILRQAKEEAQLQEKKLNEGDPLTEVKTVTEATDQTEKETSEVVPIPLDSSQGGGEKKTTDKTEKGTSEMSPTPVGSTQVEGEKKTDPAPPTEPTIEESKSTLPEDQGPALKSKRSDSLNGKQKKGVFTKILEIVGVAPKEKKESESDVSKSVFYDTESSGSTEQPKNEPVTLPVEAGKVELNVTTRNQEEVKPEVGKLASSEVLKEVNKTEVVPESKSSEGELNTSKLLGNIVTAICQMDVSEISKSDEVKELKTTGPDASEPKSEQMETPATKSEKPGDTPKDSTDIQPAGEKKTSPSPKLSLVKKPEEKPETAVTMPTPPVQTDLQKEAKNLALLAVDETILPTPPVPDQTKDLGKKEESEEGSKGKIVSEIDNLIGKAKIEVESRLQAEERKSAERQTESCDKEVSDLINTMKLIAGEEETKKGDKTQEPVKPKTGVESKLKKPEAGKKLKLEKPLSIKPEEVEELKVTTPEEREKHKGEVASSKLSSQILKAIPPPRRKTISESKMEASSSTGAIPKTTPLEAVPPEEKNIDILTEKPVEESKKEVEGSKKEAEGSKASGEKPKKASSIPVPPPRNKPKPPQPTQPKPKGKK